MRYIYDLFIYINCLSSMHTAVILTMVPQFHFGYLRSSLLHPLNQIVKLNLIWMIFVQTPPFVIIVRDFFIFSFPLIIFFSSIQIKRPQPLCFKIIYYFTLLITILIFIIFLIFLIIHYFIIFTKRIFFISLPLIILLRLCRLFRLLFRPKLFLLFH